MAVLLEHAAARIIGLLMDRSMPDKWNYHWRQFNDTGAIFLQADEAPRIHTVADMNFMLLSPDAQRLTDLAEAWKKEVTAKEIEPGNFAEAQALLKERHRRLLKGDVLGVTEDAWEKLGKVLFEEDDAVNNGSSLAFLADYHGRRCLLLGDAFPGVVRDSIGRLLKVIGAGKLQVGLTKISHHGSRNEECVFRVVEHCGPDVHLYFNHDHRPRRAAWDNAQLQQQKRFTVHYPGRRDAGNQRAGSADAWSVLNRERIHSVTAKKVPSMLLCPRPENST